MNMAAAMVYWVIVAVWLTVLGAIVVFYIRNPQAFGATRLLLVVLAIDTFRDIFENVYFGLYFGSQYGVFPAKLAAALGLPILLFMPKLLNVISGCLVLGLLLCRWLPLAVKERGTAQRGREIAEQAARLKDEFIATVSHELRTPLTAIAASLALLDDSDDVNLSEESKELIAIAHANAHRLHHLVDDILDIEKLEAGKVVFRPQRIKLEVLLKAEAAANQTVASRFGVKLRVETAPGLEIDADPDRLQQVISNLLSNAIKFSPLHGEVLLGAERRGDKIRISVRDHGPGVPAEFRARIFQKFAQADMSDARPKTGTGLGLSIVKEIVERLGGRIDFADAAGGGAVFFVDLPEAKTNETAPPAAEAREREAA